MWTEALAATALIWIGERAFLAYAAHFSRANRLYTTFGGMAAVLLWIYFSSCVCVLGVCVCAARAEIRRPGELAGGS